MFFFFAGGVEHQVRQILKSGAGRCIMCGSRADLVSCDKVLKLFFVPVWRWPGKDPLMHCAGCNSFFPRAASLPPPPESDVRDVLKCWSCYRSVDPEFNFCPYCGSGL